jgi:hypothetical protein
MSKIFFFYYEMGVGLAYSLDEIGVEMSPILRNGYNLLFRILKFLGSTRCK